MRLVWTQDRNKRWRKGFCLALWGIAMAALLAGCGPRAGFHSGVDLKQDQQGDKGKIKVVTTLFPYYDFVRQIAGERVELELVVPAGMDSHSFEPTPADMYTIQSADVLICNGGTMEHWLSMVLEAVDTRSMTIVRMMDYVDVVEEEWVEGMEPEGHEGHEEHEEEEGHLTEAEFDEHIWTSPQNAILLVRAIEEVLKEQDPLGQAQYEAAAEAYQKDLKRIDEGMRQVAQEQKRNWIVIGDKFPFRYLADAYGWDYRAAFTGCSTDTEPSARTIAYLIDLVREEQIPVIYYLELSSRRVAEIISEETGAQPLLLHSCHSVTRREFEAGVTYVELMEQNMENLRKGLDE